MLSDYRVLDLTDERGHLAGLMFRQLGAEVIAVEPPAGSSARRLGPFAGDVVDPERSLMHWAFNRGKKSVVLDLDTDEGRDRLLDLVRGADFLIDSEAPGVMAARGLGHDVLAGANPALIHASITALGGDGPRADWHMTDVTIQAAAGNMAITGDRDRAPLRVGSIPQAHGNAAAESVGACLIALYERQHRSGLGQHIDMSAQQSMNQASQSMMMAVPYQASHTQRIAGGATLQGIDFPLMWPCKDGYASVTLLFGTSFKTFTQNLMDWAHEEGFIDEATRTKNWEEYVNLLLDGSEPVSEFDRIKAALTDFFATKTKAEMLAAAMERRVLITPVTTMADVLESEQLAFREYWDDVDMGEHGTVRFPGPAAKLTDQPLERLPRPPRLGEHTEEILGAPARTANVAVRDAAPSTEPPLAGLKILDLMWVMAGPAGSRVLADYGADIVRVESVNKLDTARVLQPFANDETDPEYSGLFNNMNAGKRDLALDMSRPEAIDVIWDLVDWADVVLESFSPKGMKGFGLHYEAIAARKPEIVMLSSCLMGQTGPLAMLAGFGTMASAISGFFYPVGWPDRAPCGPFGAYTDYTSPRWLTATLLAAVDRQRATGRGEYIDFSQIESAFHQLTPAVLEYTVNGRVWERPGNRDMVLAPHGVYPTAGDDNWIAIACQSDEAWAALAERAGRGELAGLGVGERHDRHDELDDLISAWTSGLDGAELMHDLQAAGVAAYVVQNSPEFAADPQVLHRDHFVTAPHSRLGDWPIEASRFRLSRTPAVIRNAGPTIGEHTFEVLEEVLAYDADRIAELAVAEVLQ